MKCPVCKDVTLLMSEKKGIEIDYCPECRGIWLDRGELEKLVEKENERLRSNYSDYDEREKYDKDMKYSKNGKHTKRKKESIFGEIFDMFGD